MDNTHFNPAPTLPSPVIPRVKPGEGGLGTGSTRRTGRTRRSADASRVGLPRRMDRRQRRAASGRRAAVKSETGPAQYLKRRRNALRGREIIGIDPYFWSLSRRRPGSIFPHNSNFSRISNDLRILTGSCRGDMGPGLRRGNDL